MHRISEILAILDGGYPDFPMLDNGYVYPAEVRLTLFRDDAHWAMVIEALGYQYRASEFCNVLYYYGNCLRMRPREDFISQPAHAAWLESHRFDATHMLYPVSEGTGGSWMDEETLTVNPAARDLRIRGRIVPLPFGSQDYRACGVTLKDRAVANPEDLLRALAFRHREDLLATDSELREHLLRPDLPQILRLDAWRHPDLANNEMPSQTATFRMLAEVLATGDASRYKPTGDPNTHWSHWPDGGSL